LQRLHVLRHRPDGKLSPDPEGPWEGSAAKRESETLGRRMQVCTPTRESSVRIRDDREAGTQVAGDDAQQLVPGGPLPATDAGAQGAAANHRRRV
jgi:hypothetical protein